MTSQQRRISSQSYSSSNCSSVADGRINHSKESSSRRSSGDTVFSVSSLLSTPQQIFRDKRLRLYSLPEKEPELLKKSMAMRKISADGGLKCRNNHMSVKIRKFSLQVANNIQEFFDENGKY